jgi:hypothetical protein
MVARDWGHGARKVANTEARFAEYLARLAEAVGHADRRERSAPTWQACCCRARERLSGQWRPRSVDPRNVESCHQSMHHFVAGNLDERRQRFRGPGHDGLWRRVRSPSPELGSAENGVDGSHFSCLRIVLKSLVYAPPQQVELVPRLGHPVPDNSRYLSRSRRSAFVRIVPGKRQSAVHFGPLHRFQSPDPLLHVPLDRYPNRWLTRTSLSVFLGRGFLGSVIPRHESMGSCSLPRIVQLRDPQIRPLSCGDLNIDVSGLPRRTLTASSTKAHRFRCLNCQTIRNECLGRR